MSMKENIKKIVQGKRYSSESYINYLRNLGMLIGEDVTIYVPTKTLIDEQYPWMISIGNHVRITEGVKILTHDYSWSVLKSYSGGVLGSSGYIEIGNNVFIGMNAIITRNVTIGDNVIIGVGSIVTKNCEANGVYVGNPAHKIMDIDEFFEKRKKMQLEEAKILALQYYEVYHKKPEREIFHEYFMLFSDENAIKNNSVFCKKINLCGNLKEMPIYLEKYPPLFRDYDEFMRYCFYDN